MKTRSLIWLVACVAVVAVVAWVSLAAEDNVVMDWLRAMHGPSGGH